MPWGWFLVSTLGSSQLSIPPAPGHRTPSSGLHSHCTHVHTHIHKIKNKTEMRGKRGKGRRERQHEAQTVLEISKEPSTHALPERKQSLVGWESRDASPSLHAAACVEGLWRTTNKSVTLTPKVPTPTLQRQAQLPPSS